MIQRANPITTPRLVGNRFGQPTISARKRLSLNLGVLDTFWNDLPLGFQKNSLQFITGLGYALK